MCHGRLRHRRSPIHWPHYWGPSGVVCWMAFHLSVPVGAGERRGRSHGHLLPRNVPQNRWRRFGPSPQLERVLFECLAVMEGPAIRQRRAAYEQRDELASTCGVQFRNTFRTIVLLLQREYGYSLLYSAILCCSFCATLSLIPSQFAILILYPGKARTVTASNSLLRCLVRATAVVPMINGIGIGLSVLIFAFLTLQKLLNCDIS